MTDPVQDELKRRVTQIETEIRPMRSTLEQLQTQIQGSERSTASSALTRLTDVEKELANVNTFQAKLKQQYEQNEEKRRKDDAFKNRMMVAMFSVLATGVVTVIIQQIFGGA